MHRQFSLEQMLICLHSPKVSMCILFEGAQATEWTLNISPIKVLVF